METDRRGFVPVNEKMQVLDSKGKPVPHLYCIGDANGMSLSPFICLCLQLEAVSSSCLQSLYDTQHAIQYDLHVIGKPVLTRMLLCQKALQVQACSPDMCLCLIAGKYMLAHAASAQGISAVENMCGREHVLDHNTVPAACFTHPEVCHITWS